MREKTVNPLISQGVQVSVSIFGPINIVNLSLVDTMHHALQAWCIFAEFVLTH